MKFLTITAGCVLTAFTCLFLSRKLIHLYQLENYQLPGFFKSVRRSLKRTLLIHLLLIAFVKACAHRASITEIKKRDKEIAMAIHPNPLFDPVHLPEVLSKFRGKIRFRKYRSGNFFLCDAGENMKATVTLIRKFTEALAKSAETGQRRG